MAWLYVPGLQCSMKASEPDLNILASPTGPRVTSRGKLLQPRSLLALWKRVPSIQRLSGLTLPPSMLCNGAEKWIASLPDSLASHIVQPEKEKASMTIDGYGLTSLESFAKLNRHLCGSKTSQDLFQPEASSTSYLTLPGSVSMRNAVLCRQAPLELRTNASANSSWLTPRATDIQDGEKNETFILRMGDRSANCSQSLAAQVSRNWLPKLEEKWQTPVASELEGGGKKSRQGEVKLKLQAQNWPTPYGMSGIDRTGKVGAGGEFQKYIEKWSTPKASELDRAICTSELNRHTTALQVQAHHFSHQVQGQNSGNQLSPHNHTLRRRLNPAFACWLMGWPWWWTNFVPYSFALQEMALQAATAFVLLARRAGIV
jgi:hypothetical protein